MNEQPKKPTFIRIWWEMFRAWQASSLLRWSIAIRPEVYSAFIMDKANDLALKGVMAFLNREGLLHCAKCPTRAPLISLMGSYWCKKHLPIVEPEKQLVSENGKEHAHAAA